MSLPPPGSPAPTGPSDFRPAGPPGLPGAPPPFGSPPPPPPPTGNPTPPGYAAYTPYNPGTLHGPLASFGNRLGGWVIDGILYGLVMSAVAVPGIVVIIQAFGDCRRNGLDNEIQCRSGDLRVGWLLGGIALVCLGLLLVGMLYLWALATSGQTWGRRLVGVKVIDERTGEAPGWGKAIGRTAFAWFISGQILYIGYLWMIWDDRQQTLHDKVAGTHVIKV